MVKKKEKGGKKETSTGKNKKVRSAINRPGRHSFRSPFQYSSVTLNVTHLTFLLMLLPCPSHCFPRVTFFMLLYPSSRSNHASLQLAFCPYSNNNGLRWHAIPYLYVWVQFYFLIFLPFFFIYFIQRLLISNLNL